MVCASPIVASGFVRWLGDSSQGLVDTVECPHPGPNQPARVQEGAELIALACCSPQRPRHRPQGMALILTSRSGAVLSNIFRR